MERLVGGASAIEKVVHPTGFEPVAPRLGIVGHAPAYGHSLLKIPYLP